MDFVNGGFVPSITATGSPAAPTPPPPPEPVQTIQWQACGNNLRLDCDGLTLNGDPVGGSSPDLTNYARKDQSNTFTAGQTVTGLTILGPDDGFIQLVAEAGNQNSVFAQDSMGVSTGVGFVTTPGSESVTVRVGDKESFKVESEFDSSKITLSGAGSPITLIAGDAAINIAGAVLNVYNDVYAEGLLQGFRSTVVDPNNSFQQTYLIESDGKVKTNQTISASTPGTVVAKMPIYNIAGTLVGYIPVYNSIT